MKSVNDCGLSATVNIRIVPIDKINAAAYSLCVDLQPGDVE
ncbi:hypothetical protein NZ043_27335 [Paenibacillus sp. FSL k6-2145]